ncbi:MAG: hypothetical protein KatS3mg102_1318 [Planctomycetota bacterium]|nr:MAG: hypothetical protein KatS3mg102_1318 [Planctomycetota bacterium]
MAEPLFEVPPALVVSCEHAGNRVPRRWAALFRGRERLLASHRGWDPGALELARALARAAGVPLFAVHTTRLLVDPNRSEHNRRALFSELTRSLPPAERERILERCYRPHRRRVQAHIAALLAAGRTVVHVGVHTFTPVRRGRVRRCEVGWLYDPRRRREKAFCLAWQRAVRARAPRLRLRRNYPYRGRSDGLGSALRRRLPPARYLAIELEINQRLRRRGGPRWQRLIRLLGASCLEALGQLAHRALAPARGSPPPGGRAAGAR